MKHLPKQNPVKQVIFRGQNDTQVHVVTYDGIVVDAYQTGGRKPLLPRFRAMKRLICLFRGHRWELRETDVAQEMLRHLGALRVCTRCGKIEQWYHGLLGWYRSIR